MCVAGYFNYMDRRGNSNELRAHSRGESGRSGSHDPHSAIPRQKQIALPLPIPIPEKDETEGRLVEPGTLLYRVGPGNNGELVEAVILRRKGWRAASSADRENFRWQQSNWGYKYLSEEVVFNHLEYHKELSNKQNLVRNLTWFCESNKINAFQITPTTFIIDLHDEFVSLAISLFTRFFNHNNPKRTRTKDTLFIKKVKVLHPRAEKRAHGLFYCRPVMASTLCTDFYAWVLKPTFLNRGRGIHVFNDL
jgi:hypothetical protein